MSLYPVNLLKPLLSACRGVHASDYRHKHRLYQCEICIYTRGRVLLLATYTFVSEVRADPCEQSTVHACMQHKIP